MNLDTLNWNIPRHKFLSLKYSPQKSHRKTAFKGPSTWTLNRLSTFDPPDILLKSLWMSSATSSLLWRCSYVVGDLLFWIVRPRCCPLYFCGDEFWINVFLSMGMGLMSFLGGNSNRLDWWNATTGRWVLVCHATVFWPKFIAINDHGSLGELPHPPQKWPY